MNGERRMRQEVETCRTVPKNARMAVGQRSTIQEMINSGEVRAIGKYRDLGQGAVSIPVVYVSKRSKPWYERRWVHVVSIVSGLLLLLTALATWAILAIGAGWFIAGVIAASIFVAWLARFSRGATGRGHSVDVTTSTRVRVRR